MKQTSLLAADEVISEFSIHSSLAFHIFPLTDALPKLAYVRTNYMTQ